MTTCLGKSCSFGLPRVPFVNCCQFMYLVISLLGIPMHALHVELLKKKVLRVIRWAKLAQ